MASVGISIPPQEHVTSPVAAVKPAFNDGAGRHFEAFARRSSGQGGQSERAAASQRLMRKRSWSMHGDWRGLKRRRKGIVPPTKFLLGGNICDPLNLGSLNDEEANRIANANTPVSSPMPTPKYRKEPIEVIIPPDISDPLGLNGPDSLLSPAAQRRRRCKRRRKQSSGPGGEPTGRSLSESSVARSSSDGDTGPAFVPPAAAAPVSAVELEFSACAEVADEDRKEVVPTVPAPPAAAPAVTTTDDDKATAAATDAAVADESATAAHAAAVADPATVAADVVADADIAVTAADVATAVRPSSLSVCVEPAATVSGGPTAATASTATTPAAATTPGTATAATTPGATAATASAAALASPVPRSGRTHCRRPSNEIVSPAVPQPGGRPAQFGRTEQRSGAAPPDTPVFRQRDAAFQYGNYNRYYGYRNPDPEQMDPRLGWLRREWFAGFDVLDVGCNVGHVTLTVARDYAPRRCVGLDIDASLIKAARRNVKHYQRADGFPVSMRAMYGDLRPAHKAPGTQFPRNVTFQHANFVLESDALLDTVKAEFDTVLCLSITKWVHLNFGDAGIKRFFRRAFLSLKPGGRLLLEPQPWPSYVKKKKLTPRIWENYHQIRLRPETFPDLLINEIGFERYQTVGRPHHSARGFSRQLQLFTKAKELAASTTTTRNVGETSVTVSPSATVAMDTTSASPSEKMPVVVAMDTTAAPMDVEQTGEHVSSRPPAGRDVTGPSVPPSERTDGCPKAPVVADSLPQAAATGRTDERAEPARTEAACQ